MLKLRQDLDEEWQELEELMKTNPRRATYRFQTQPTRRLTRFGRRTILPLAVPLFVSWWILGDSSGVTGIFMLAEVVAALVFLVACSVTFYRGLLRGRLLKKYAAEYMKQFPDSSPRTDYAIGQAWIIQRCLAEEKTRASKCPKILAVGSGNSSNGRLRLHDLAMKKHMPVAIYRTHKRSQPAALVTTLRSSSVCTWAKTVCTNGTPVFYCAFTRA